MPNIGKIAQIIGPVVDVSFANDAHLPKIFSALENEFEKEVVLVSADKFNNIFEEFRKLKN